VGGAPFKKNASAATPSFKALCGGLCGLEVRTDTTKLMHARKRAPIANINNPVPR